MAVVFSLLLVPMVGARAQEGYRDHYREGREAFDAGRWEAVVSSMRLALKERANERGRVLGMPFGRYVPRYYLGVALAELGRCSSALRVIREAEEDGAVTKIPELFSDLEARKKACSGRLRSLQQELRRGRSEVADVRSLVESAMEKAENPILGTVEVQEGLERASEQLDAAEAGLKAAARAESPAAARRASDPALSVRSEVEDLLEVMAGREAAAREFAEQKRERVAELARQGRILVERAHQLEPLPAPLTDRVARLEHSLQRAAEDDAETDGVSTLEALERSLGRQVADLREALRPPPKAITAAAEAYLAGQYERAVSLLDEIPRGEGRAAAHACLLRLASWVTLAERTRREDLLERAAGEVDACPDLEEHADLPPGLFSPAVLSFLDAAIRARWGPPAPAARPLQ